MSDSNDFHGYEAKLQGTIKRILKDPKIRAPDKQLIVDYLRHCEAQGLSAGRIFKYAWQMQSIAREMPCSFKVAKRKDIERLVAWIHSSGKYSAWTKSDLKKNIKHFYKFVRYGNVDRATPFPPEVIWIPTVIKKSEIVEEPVLTEDEVKRMIEVAPSLRDKALIAVAYEGGYRVPSEILAMRVGDVTFEESGVRILVKQGKTGPRNLLLLSSMTALSLYLDSHPYKDNPDAPLWIGIEGPNKNKPLKYASLSGMLKKVAKDAGVKKRVHPYLFRHSAATRDAENDISDRFLETKFGWTRGSKMAAHYSRAFDKNALDAKTMEVYGGKEAPKKVPTFRPHLCPRCKTENTPGTRYCGKCGSPLDLAEVVKSEERFDTLNQTVNALSKQVEETNRRIVSVVLGELEGLLKEAKKLPPGQRQKFLEKNGIALD